MLHKISKLSFNISLILSSTLLISACQNEANLANEQENVQTNEAIAGTEQVLTDLITFSEEALAHKVDLDGIETQYLDSKNKLQVIFSKDASIPTMRIEPDSPWDLSNLPAHNIAIDVKNVSESSAHLYLSLENPEGKSQRHSLSLAKGFEGTIFVPITGMEAETETGLWGDAPIWPDAGTMMVWRSWRSGKPDLSKLAKVDIFMIGTLEDKTLEINNLRIRKNPPSDPNWMKGIVDQFGQNTMMDYAGKVKSESELKALANAELAALAASKGPEHRSKFGGYTKGPKLEATGYFRTEKVDGKWWMVDPEGYVFFSHGPANVRMANMTTLTGIDYDAPEIRKRRAEEVTPEDSMGIIKIPNDIKAQNYVISPLRNDMFTWLPDYDHPLAEHYSYRRSTHKGAIPYGETFSFYRANLHRRYGNDGNESYLRKWEEVTIDRMRDWGFTSFGNWVDPAFYAAKQVPYFANGWIIGDFKTLSGYKNHWGLMPDPFDPVFAERAQYTIDVLKRKVKGSPWCAGIFIDNEKSWGERTGTVPQRYGVILDALSKSVQDSPAKAAFSERLKAKYGSIDALNKAWNTNIADWSALDAGVEFTEYSDKLVADLSSLLEALGEQYFVVVHNTLEKALPNHLYMGARMANWGMPDEIIKASLKYSDVLSFNIYEEGVQPHAWDFLEEVDLPTVIGEFHIGTSSDSGMFNPGIVHASDQQDRAQMYKDYMASVLSKPYMVGAHWFQYVDEPLTGRAFDGENANIGFVNVADIPYPHLIDAVKDVTYNMYQQRLEKE
ncbi:agarase [Agaribacter flavus]|uniref:Agarase n=1 Tax=Agaribacter flavus TaxID=1902781 RepID=A0ABV7FK42_9ALTE